MTGRRPIVLAIPVLNEVESIGPVLDAIPAGAVDGVLVMDGGSTDGTQAAATARGATVLDVGRGYGRACLRAAEAAPRDAILVYMDGDGADDPAAIPRLVAPVAEGAADLVIGSRTRGRREPGSMGWHQVAAGHALGLGMWAVTGTRYTDMCAFRALRAETVLGLGLREMTYGWNLEMQMAAARRRLRILELPVDCRCRIGGASKVAGSLRGTLKAGSRILATFARVAVS